MRFAEDLSRDQLIAIVRQIQSELYLDQTDHGRLVWHPEKDWSGADVLQNIASKLNCVGLVPEEPIEAV